MIMNYARSSNPKKSAKAYGRDLRISTKSSVTVCKALSGKSLDRGKNFLVNLLIQRQDIGGKYYTKATKEIMGIISSAEHNAEFKGLDPGRLMIFASAHQGFRFWRPRNFKRRREKRKMTNIQVVLEER
jgi:large subunit ribosomal protein L22